MCGSGIIPGLRWFQVIEHQTHWLHLLCVKTASCIAKNHCKIRYNIERLQGGGAWKPNSSLWIRPAPCFASPVSATPLTSQESVMSNMMNRLESLNELYTPQAYLTDLTKLVFAEADNHRKVTPYRIALQNTMFAHLSRALNNGNSKVRPAVLYTLQQLERKTKAASQSAPDSESRAHWANLYDQIGRLLVWK